LERDAIGTAHGEQHIHGARLEAGAKHQAGFAGAIGAGESQDARDQHGIAVPGLMGEVEGVGGAERVAARAADLVSGIGDAGGPGDFYDADVVMGPVGWEWGALALRLGEDGAHGEECEDEGERKEQGFFHDEWEMKGGRPVGAPGLQDAGASPAGCRRSQGLGLALVLLFG